MSLDQTVSVRPVKENERAIVGAPKLKDSAPIRCQIYTAERLLGSIPITFDEMGHPNDIIFNIGSVERVRELAFVWGGQVFKTFIDITIRPGTPLHLDIRHMKLLNKFGLEALKAGK